MVVRIFSFAAVLTLGCASLAAAATKNIDRTLPLNATGTVVLDAHNGRIHVQTWDRPQIEVHVRIDWPGVSTSSYRYRDASVDVDGSSDRVSIRWHYDDNAWSLWDVFGGNWIAPDVEYNITAPKTAHLQIHTHNARTEITGFAGALDLSTHNGSTRVDFASFTHDARVEMHNGSVEFNLPSNSKFNFESRGHHARVDSDFAPVTHASYSGWRESNVGGTVNGGGSDIRIVSHNGVVRLHSKG